jgi:pimeloyl-ACP methyl ester carboxylesterase
MYKIALAGLACLIATRSSAQRISASFLNPKDSTTNYYIAVTPDAGPAKALMVLIPGAFQTPEYASTQTTLPQEAAKQGIVTIIPLSVRGMESFGIDSSTQQSLAQQIQHAVSQFKLQGKTLYVGGFSLGGSAAVKYAELAPAQKGWLKPDAVFAIDPPLDFERYYNAAKRIIALTPAEKVNKELPFMTGKIEQEMGGTPQTALNHFYQLSPYSYTDQLQRAVKTLVQMPLMLITEPDVDWWLQQRGYDYMMMNSVDQAAMINELQKMGNNNALLVTTRDKGYREPGHVRHPHSFSIADNAYLLQWLQSFGTKQTTPAGK